MSTIESDRSSANYDSVMATPDTKLTCQASKLKDETSPIIKRFDDDFLKPLPILPRGSAYQEG